MCVTLFLKVLGKLLQGDEKSLTEDEGSKTEQNEERTETVVVVGENEPVAGPSTEEVAHPEVNKKFILAEGFNLLSNIGVF